MCHKVGAVGSPTRFGMASINGALGVSAITRSESRLRVRVNPSDGLAQRYGVLDRIAGKHLRRSLNKYEARLAMSRHFQDERSARGSQITFTRTLIPSGYETYFRERARYVSAHTSARVEGNPLSDDEALIVLSGEAEPIRPEEREVTNLQEAYVLMEQLTADATLRIDHGLLRAMNSVILKDLAGARSHGAAGNIALDRA